MTPSISFEFFPPAPGKAETRFWNTVERLSPLEPAFLSLTFGAGGTNQSRSDRILRGMLARGQADAAGHLTCVGITRAEVDALARAWAEAGLRRVVALRGDMPGLSAPYAPHPEGYRNAADLVAGLRRIADFDISVAAYPECHPDSADPAADLDNLKRKFDAGADRAITQYFFDAEVYLRFRDRAARAGLRAPIVPGIMPIATVSGIRRMAGMNGTDFPPELEVELQRVDGDDEATYELGVRWATMQCEELLASGVDGIHFYTLNRSPATREIYQSLFG